MPAICRTETLTGHIALQSGWLGPVAYVEVLSEGFDTNTGHDEPPSIYWRKATNADLCKLTAIMEFQEG